MSANSFNLSLPNDTIWCQIGILTSFCAWWNAQVRRLWLTAGFDHDTHILHNSQISPGTLWVVSIHIMRHYSFIHLGLRWYPSQVEHCCWRMYRRYIYIVKQIITSGLIHIRSWTYLAVHENEHYYAPLLLKPKGYCVSKKQEASFQALTDLRHSEAS